MMATLYALCSIVLMASSYGICAILIEVAQHTAR